MSALSGIKVLDLSQAIAGPFASRLLADLGADVVRVEDPGSPDPMRQEQDGIPADETRLMFEFLNWNKRSIELNLSSPEGKEVLRELVQTCHIMFESYQPGYLASLGLEYEQLQAWNPALVLVSVTPFGQSGPYSGFNDSDLVLQAMSGIMRISGRVDRPPLKHGLDQSYFCAGLNAAYVALAAYFAALRQGIGEHVDLSIHECLVSELVMNQPMYTFAGVIQNRRAVVQDPFAGEPIAVKNGYVSFQTGGGSPIQTLADVFGDDRFRNPDYARGVYRIEHADRINAEVSQMIGPMDAREAFLKAAEHRLLAGFVQTAENLLTCPQLQERGFFVDMEVDNLGWFKFPGRVLSLSGGIASKPKPAPRMGEHTQQVLQELLGTTPAHKDSHAAKAELPLKGIRVLDLSTVFAVPYLGGLMADLGAEVIKLESPTRVDQSRKPTTGPYLNNSPGDEPWNEAGIFYVLNRGKKSVVIDLSQEEGRAILRDLVEKVDVLLENFTPRVLRKWGLGYDELRKINPRLILLSNTGYGQTGPWANFPTQGTTLECTMGIANYTGYRDDKPWKVGQSYPDFLACWSGLIGVFAALIERERTGLGQAIDISMYEIGVSLVTRALLHYQLSGNELPRIGNEDFAFVPSNLYRSRGEDQWVALTVKSDGQWHALARMIGDPILMDESLGRLSERHRRRHEIDKAIENWTASQANVEVMEKLQAIGIACGALFNARDLLLDGHLRARGFYEVVCHPQPIGNKPLIGRPYRLRNRQVRIAGPAPKYGQHNREILTGLLRYDSDRIAHLYGQGVVYDRPAQAYKAEPMPLQAMLSQKIISAVVPDFEQEIAKAYPLTTTKGEPAF